MKILSNVFAILLTPGAIILRSWVVTKLWLWFVVAQFGLPALSIALAFGITLILYATFPKTNLGLYLDMKTSPQLAMTLVVADGVASLLLLGMGWVTLSFM